MLAKACLAALLVKAGVRARRGVLWKGGSIWDSGASRSMGERDTGLLFQRHGLPCACLCS